jgi:hypothetical protein
MMNKNHWIENCPDCDEVLRQFYLKKAFIPEDSTRSGWSGVEGYFCAGCDKLLIAVGFDSGDRETFWIAAPTGDFAIPASPPGRGHSCYVSHAIKTAAAGLDFGFTALRSIHAEIGPRHKPDDPRLTLAISDSQADFSGIVETLRQWLTNTNCGRVISQEHESDVYLLHVELSEPVRARHMMDRLVRKFGLANSAKLFAYNEGRRYSIG